MPKRVSTTSRAALEKKLQETQDEITRLRRRYDYCQCVPFTEADGIRELRGLYEVLGIPIPEDLGGPMNKEERRAVKVTYEDCPETLKLMHSRAKSKTPRPPAKLL